MKEVSCRIVQVFFRELQARKLSPDVLVTGTGCELQHFLDRSERIDWDVFCRFFRNIQEVWSDEELVELGGMFMRSRYFRPFFAIGRLMFSAEELYRWANDPVRGVGRQLVSCILPRVTELGRNHLLVELTLAPGYAMCRGFFVTTFGALKYTPLLVGGSPADIDMRMTDRGAVYEIRLPEGRGILSRLRLTFSYPFTVRTAARELKDAHELLVKRYSELTEARDALARQALQLRTAHRINQAVRGSLDLDERVNAITDALNREAGFAAVELRVTAEMDSVRMERHESCGHVSGDAPFVVPLIRQDRALGELRLWPEAAADLEERRELLEFLTPIVAVALEESLVYTALLDYRQNLDRKVSERTAELMEAQRVRDRIFANINHEIRTPLSLILLTVDELRRQTTEQFETTRLNAIDHSARQLVRLVDGLLLLAARQEGKLTVRPQPFDLGSLLAAIVEAWRPAASAQRVALEYHGPVSLVVSLDASMVERIVVNLVSNALKYTSMNGEVVISLIEDGEDVTIAVIDDGPGIDPKLRERLFDRFERGEAARQTGTRGSGIGLSVVKELADAHGGGVSVHSEPGSGSVFRVRLPLARESASPKAKAVTMWPSDFGHVLPATRLNHDFGGPEDAKATILVAEDDDELRIAIARLLSDEYRVIVAQDGNNAIRLAERHLPDLLVSDIEMPGIDGIELTRRWQRLPGSRLAPVVLLTAYGRLEDRLAGFDAGAVDFVVKPFEPLELLARVRSQLAMRSMALRLLETEKLRAEVAEYKAKAAEAQLFSSALEAERKQKQMQQQFLQKLLTSQERERRRIAGDLHDSLGQELVIVRIRAMMAMRVLDEPDTLRPLLTEIAETAAAVMQRVREISHNLRPAELERLGLTTALNAMLDRVATGSATRWNVDIQNIDGVFSEEKEIILYRILQEAVNNIVKHARASLAGVHIQRKNGELSITVSDDGDGIPSRQIREGEENSAPTFGLHGMQERVRMLEGTMSVASEEKQGTCIDIVLPTA